MIERIAAENFAFNTYNLRNKYTLKDYTNLQKLVKVLQMLENFIEEITEITVQKSHLSHCIKIV